MTYLPYLYFAYGSNLSLKQMRRRCPGAEPVGPFGFGGWRLEFAGRRGVANIVRTDKDADFVEGALYRITAACEQSLDRFEGFSHRDPRAGTYTKVDFVIPATQEDVVMYVMNNHACRYTSPPDNAYLDRVREGYDDWGISKRGLMDAARRCGWRRPSPPPVADVRTRDLPVSSSNGWPRTVAPAPKRALHDEWAANELAREYVERTEGQTSTHAERRDAALLDLLRAQKPRPRVRGTDLDRRGETNGVGTGKRRVP